MENLTGDIPTWHYGRSDIKNPFYDINWEIDEAQREQLLDNIKKHSDKAKKEIDALEQRRSERREVITGLKECTKKLQGVIGEVRKDIKEIIENLEGAQSSAQTFLAQIPNQK